MARSTSSNPPGSTQTASGRVVRDGRPVHDSSRGHLMPAGHESANAPDHLSARRGQAGHQQ